MGSSPFAELPGEGIDHAEAGTFHFLGGHRLWRAPEIPAVTYLPDDGPITIEESGGVFEMVGQRDVNGIVKRLSVSQRGAFTIVDHVLENHGDAALLAAPWAITQLAPGGFAYIPISTEPIDPDGVLPNRQLVIWPYTDLSAPEIQFTEDKIMVHSSVRRSKMKVGLANTRGWLAYHFGDELFVKWSHVRRDEAFYVDLGASVQCYRDERFLELETLGSRAQLGTGEHVTHREVWTLLPLDGATADDVLDELPTAPEGIVL
jgi:hypothetical protein